ncbi:MAG: hypothetical protein L0Y58_23150 [Verrucomicrobia subdivision 3 bacterium]|nr:hypothetical protein [Limisphaerales bacterium]
MSRKRSKLEAERNITIALTDSELRTLKRLGQLGRQEFVSHVQQRPRQIEIMPQAELETMVKEAAPLEPQQLGRMIILELLQRRGRLPWTRETPSFISTIIAGAVFYSGDPNCSNNTYEKRTSITIPLSRAERAALNKVAAEVAASISDQQSRPSIVARLTIMSIAQRCDAFFSKPTAESAAGAPSDRDLGSPA